MAVLLRKYWLYIALFFVISGILTSIIMNFLSSSAPVVPTDCTFVENHRNVLEDVWKTL